MKFLLTLAIGVLYLGHTTQATLHDNPPNFVFIIADDLGWADVGFHGGRVPMPNLERLRQSGAELTQHYVAPLCSPTRTGFMTGRYWSRFGVTTPQAVRALPFETVTIAKALKTCGYETCLTGKWHLGSKPEWGPAHFGFDHSYGSLGGGVGPFNHFYKQGPFEVTWHRDGQLIQEEGHVTDLIATEAVNWIRARSDRPFFLYVPLTAVHLPVKEPMAYLDRVPDEIAGDVPRHYAACLLHLDDAVGRIIDAVKASDKSGNTVIVFTSDNGGSTAENHDPKYPADDYPSGKLAGSNLPLRGQKGEPWEGGTRVPTLLCWPGHVKPGSVCNTPLHITDWMPTFCELAGFQSETDLKWDGTSIVGAITGQNPLPERALYSAAPRFEARVLRAGDWKLIVWAPTPKQPERTELFRIADDPGEQQNLAESRPDKVRELKELLAQAMIADLDSVVSTRAQTVP